MRKASDVCGRIRGAERRVAERDGRDGMGGYGVGCFTMVKILTKVSNTMH